MTKEEFKKSVMQMTVGDKVKYNYIGDVVAEVEHIGNGYKVSTPYWRLVFPTVDLVFKNLLYYC